MNAQFLFSSRKGSLNIQHLGSTPIFCAYDTLSLLTVWKENTEIFPQMLDLRSVWPSFFMNLCCWLFRIVKSWPKLCSSWFIKAFDLLLLALVRERAWSKFGSSCSSKNFVISSLLCNRRFVSQTVLILPVRSSAAMAISNPPSSL